MTAERTGAAPPEGLEVPEGGPFALLQKWEQEVTTKVFGEDELLEGTG